MSLLLCAWFTYGCGDDCAEFMDLGDVRLNVGSAALLNGVEGKSTAYFLDTLGEEYRFQLSTSEEFAQRHMRCDSNNDRMFLSEEPITRSFRLQNKQVAYTLDSRFTVNLGLRVWHPQTNSDASLPELLNMVTDQLSIFLTDTPDAGLTFSSFVDNRNRDGVEPWEDVKFVDEIMLGNKLFYDVYFDDKYADRGNDFITYFNMEHGLVGIRSEEQGLLLYLDRVE